MTLGLFGFVINAGLLLLVAWISADSTASRSRSATSRRTCSTARRPSSVGRPRRRSSLASIGHSAARACGRPPDDRRARSGAAARRFGTPLYVTDLAILADAAAAGLRRAFPDPWIRQYSVKANDVPAVIAGRRGPRRRGERRLARRVGGRAPRRASRTSGSRSRGSARPTPTCGRPARVARDGRSAALGRGRIGRRGWRSLAASSRAAGRADGRRSTSSSGSTRTSLPETLRRAGRRARVPSKFGMTETELTDADRALGGGPDGPLRPRGIHLHVGSQLGAVDAWRDARPPGAGARGACCAARSTASTPSTSAAASRSSARRAGTRPGSLRPRAPGAPRRHPRRPPAHAGSRSNPAGSSSPGPAGWSPASSTSAIAAGRQVVLDAGMTELIRPALYGARHPIVALTSLGPVDRRRRRRAPRVEPTRVEGPICESTDSLGDPRPAAAAARRPRGHRRRRRLRRVAVVDLQRPAAAAAGPAGRRRRRSRLGGAGSPDGSAKVAA